MNIVKTTVEILIPIMLLIVCLPFINPDYEKDEGWVYDDYKECEPDTIVSGSFEKITYNDKIYIHAKSIGNGTIDGKEFKVSKSTLQIILIWGQSNSAYGVNPITGIDRCEPIKTNAYYFGTENGPTISTRTSDKQQISDNQVSDSTIHSMINPDGTLKIGNIEGPFASKYTENTKNYRPYMINAGVPGWKLDKFLPGNAGNINLKEIWDAAIDSIDTDKFNITYGCWIMSQGEADYLTPDQIYLNEFAEVNAYLTDTLNLEKGLIIRTRTISDIYSNFGHIAEDQDIIVKEYPNVYFGSKATNTFTIQNGLMLNDDLHYSQLGDNIIGMECAETWLSIFNEGYIQIVSLNKLMSIIPIIILAAIIIVVARTTITSKEY